jgi:pSer/pThr/pTyr-binding forkhead associated (FHA) protein
MDEPLAVALKFGFLAVLYLFLLWVVRSSMRDLARYGGGGAAEPVETPSPGRRKRGPQSRRNGGAPRLIVVAAMAHEPGTTFDVRVEDPFASSAHARIDDRGGERWLEDMGSTNGTYLNGRQVKTAQRLSTGDTIRIGDSEYRYEE